MSELNELIEKAKKLGIKRPDLMREDTLTAKIKDAESAIGISSDAVVEPVVAEEPVKEPVRSTAPSMNLNMIDEDDRIKLLEKLEAADPECKYVFKRADVTNDELAAIGLERTDQRLKNDIVCRTTLKSYKELQSARNKAEFKSMKNIDGGTGKIQSKTAKAKRPPELDETEN